MPPSTKKNRWKALDGALRDLAHAIKTLQLYPEGSPVVTEALEEAHDAFEDVLDTAPVVIEVLPSAVRIDGESLGDGSPTIQQLASRLHHRGVARIAFDDSLTPDSLGQLADLIAASRDRLEERGGLQEILEGERPDGIKADFLELERLFQAARGKASQLEADSVWDALLTGFQEQEELPRLSWEELATDPELLQGLLEWMLARCTEIPALTAYSQVDLLRLVCERVGTIASELGEAELSRLVVAVRDIHDRLDPEAWMELLTEPLMIKDERPVPATTGSPGPTADRVADSAAGTQDPTVGPTGRADGRPEGTPDSGTPDLGEAEDDADQADLSLRLAKSLDADDVESLIVYGLETRERVTPRLLKMCARVLDARPDRRRIVDDVERNIREMSARGEAPGRMLDAWGDLTDVLLGEDADPYVSQRYRSTLESLWDDPVGDDIWPSHGFRLRMAEMDPGYLASRKCQVLISILRDERSDRDYAILTDEIQGALPDLVEREDLEVLKEVVEVYSRDMRGGTRTTERRRSMAREILEEFRREEILLELIRGLVGKGEDRIETMTSIVEHLGNMSVPTLLQGLAHERSRQVRLLLLRMISAMGEKALPQIEKHIRDERWFFVRNLVWVIGEIGDQQFAGHLALTANHSDARVRRETVRALAKMGGDRASRVLVELVDDPDPKVRINAIRGLGHCGSRTATTRLIELLRLSNWRGQNTDVIQAAAVALGRLGDPDALPALRKVAKSPWIFRERRRSASRAARWALDVMLGRAEEESGVVEELEPDDEDRERQRDTAAA